MEVHQEAVSGIRIFRVFGPMTGDASLDLRRSINGYLNEIAEDKKPKIVLNLKKVNSCDSSGIGVMSSAYSSVEERGGRLVFSGVSMGLQNLFSITKRSYFEIFDDENAAISNLKS